VDCSRDAHGGSVLMLRCHSLISISPTMYRLIPNLPGVVTPRSGAPFPFDRGWRSEFFIYVLQ